MLHGLINALKAYGLAIIVGVTASPLFAREYYVAQSAANASDENSGTEASPWKTIGRNIKSVSAGDTVHIGEGVYREQIVLTGETWDFDGVTYSPAPCGKSFGEMLSFVGEPGQKVVIKGSDVVSNWTPYKEAIWVCDWPYNSQQVFCDGKPMTQIAGKMVPFFQDPVSWNPGMKPEPRWRGRKGDSLKDIEAGSFYVDLEAKKLFVWMADGSDPAKHVIEAGARTFGFCLYETQYIRLANLSIQHANSSAASNWGGLTMFGAGHLIENVDSSWNDAAGLHLSGKDHTIVNSTFDHNGWCGIAGTASRTRILNCQTNYDNRRKWWKDWGSGGVKLVPRAQLTISGHRSAYNDGPGIWFDIYCSDVIIENCVVHDNSDSGIFYEISDRGIIRNNISYNNRGRGIYISNSSKSLVAHNLVYGNGMSGIVVSGVNRNEAPLIGHPETRYVWADSNQIYGNILMDNCHPDRCPRDKDGKTTTWSLRPEIILADPSQPSNQNNISDYNVFYRTGNRPIPFWAGWDTKKTPDLASWQNEMGLESHSVIAEPLFVNLAKFDFHPTAKSPIFLAPALPGAREDADGRRFDAKKSANGVAAGPYAGQ
jgi:parallel beta-helix repeat protein